MKPTLFAALLVAASVVPWGTIVQAQHLIEAQHKGTGNPNDLINLPESGPAVVPGGGATTGPNFRGLAITPLPGSREEMDMVRPNEAQLPPPEVRPVPGKPLPSPLTTR
jgi:hypothetical protein